MEIRYREHVFQFEQLAIGRFEGRLLLEDSERRLLEELLAAEDDDWGLDQNGERLPRAQLFERSPWSSTGPAGSIKLLFRSLDIHDGRAMFSTRDSYLEGGLFDWLRNRG
jgi:hypothetical protein